ncbi:MAG: MlaD family protein [Treponema sp.]|nr:MlaD family protein [Treponema sp.]
MKFSIRFADQIVGTLVILALAMLIFVIFMLGKNQRWFVTDYQYRTYLYSASGVSPNMAIQYKGFTIGRVKKISLAPDDRVEVIFTIFEEYAHRVTEGSLVEVQESPIGLGNSFIFHFGLGEDIIPEGNVIPEINSQEARIYIARGLSEVPKGNDSINNIVNQVNTILEMVSVSLAGSEGAEEYELGQIIGNLGRTISSITVLAETLSDQLSPLINNLENFTGQLSDPSGALMGILDGEGPLYDAIESLAGIIENLNRFSEFLPSQLPQLAVLINELNVAMRSVQDVLTAVANNPLLKGGIPDRPETGPAGSNTRDHDF